MVTDVKDVAVQQAAALAVGAKELQAVVKQLYSICMTRQRTLCITHQAASDTCMLLQEYWLPINALTAIMFPVIAFFEITRLQGFAKTGKVSTLAPFAPRDCNTAKQAAILLITYRLASCGESVLTALSNCLKMECCLQHVRQDVVQCNFVYEPQSVVDCADVACPEVACPSSH